MGKHRAPRWGSRDRHTTEKVREAGCKETHFLPCAVFARSAKQHTGIPDWAAWGRRDDALSGENSPCPAQTPAHLNRSFKLHLNNFLCIYLCISLYLSLCLHVKSLQLCLTLHNPMDSPTRLLCTWDSPSKNTGVGCRTLFQGIFPTQESNP